MIATKSSARYTREYRYTPRARTRRRVSPARRSRQAYAMKSAPRTSAAPGDDDVLRGRPLEPERIDEDVEERPGDRERGGEQVRKEREHDERDDVERDPPGDRQARRDAMRRQRPVSRAAHPLVEVAVEIVVEGRRPAARGRAADERRNEDPERRYPVRGEEHPAERRDQEQRHDRGLRERDEVANELALGRGRSPGDRRERDDAAPEQARGRRVRAERPWRESRERIRRADRDLREEDGACRDRERAEAGGVASMAPRLDARDEHQDAHRARDVAVGHVDRSLIRIKKLDRPFAQRPGHAYRRRTGAADVRPAEHQYERANGGREREPGPTRCARARELGPPHDHREAGERREQELGVREMERHPLRRQLEDHGDRAEHGL